MRKDTNMHLEAIAAGWEVVRVFLTFQPDAAHWGKVGIVEAFGEKFPSGVTKFPTLGNPWGIENFAISAIRAAHTDNTTPECRPPGWISPSPMAAETLQQQGDRVFWVEWEQQQEWGKKKAG